MKVGVFTVLLADRPLEDALDYAKEVGCEAVEIGTGANPETLTASQGSSCRIQGRGTSSGRPWRTGTWRSGVYAR